MATDIGTRIRRARERRHWSQQRLADALEVDRKTVDNWENGRTRPRSRIGAIEDVLGLRLDGEPPSPVPEDLRRDIMTAGIDDEAKADILAYAERRLTTPRGGTGSSGREASPEPPRRASRSASPGSGRGERGTA